MFWISYFLLPFFFSLIAAECPNGCSGNGVCEARDQCTCYPGHMGNDCSQYSCPFGYAHVDTAKGDLNFDGSITTSAISINTPPYPNGAVEGFPTSAVNQEAHFYMECSNNGICDRTSGACECFPAYEGHACQRQSCPNACSQRGTCETMANLATKADGTLYGNTEGYGTTTYDLWDAHLIQGCRCDPWYQGPDCSQRSCKVGIDPLYKDRNTPTYENFFLVIGDTGGSSSFDTSRSTFRLRLFDYYGEGYLTSAISIPAVNADATICDLCPNIVSAVTELPNSPFPDFQCTASTIALDVYVTTGQNNVHLLACEFTGTAGPLRFPEIEDLKLIDASTHEILKSTYQIATLTGTTLRGENQDWAQTYEGLVTINNAATDATTALATAFADTLGATTKPTLLRVANQYLVADTAASALLWSWPLPTITNERLYSAPASALTVKDEVGDWAAGGTEITTTAANPLVSRGDWIIYENQIFKVTEAVAGGSAATITVDRPFFGKSDDGSSISSSTGTNIYKITVPDNIYTYVGECSFKGLCDHDTGLCQCFKGYTGDDCSQQNALAN